MNPPTKYAQPPSNVPLLVGGGVAALILVGLGASYGWGIYELSKQRTVVEELKSQRTRELSRHLHLEERLGDLKIQQADLETLRNAIAGVQSKLRETQAKLKLLQPQWRSANASMQTAIEAVQKAMETSPVPNVPGPKGETLINVKLKALRPGEVTLEHDAGMSRVTFKDLSPALADRLQPEWWPTLNLPPSPPQHESVNAFLSAFAIPARPLVPAAPEEAVASESELATDGYFQNSVIALRTQISKLQIFIEDATRQTGVLKAKEAQASQKNAKSLSLQRGMDSRAAQQELRAARMVIEKEIQVARVVMLRLQSELKKMNK